MSNGMGGPITTLREYGGNFFERNFTPDGRLSRVLPGLFRLYEPTSCAIFFDNSKKSHIIGTIIHMEERRHESVCLLL